MTDACTCGPDGDHLAWRGFTWSPIRRGDILLRPLVPAERGFDHYLHRFLNAVLPLGLGHAMLYAGGGEVLNVQPTDELVFIEGLLDNLERYPEVAEHPEHIVFVRLDATPDMIERVFGFLLAHQGQAVFKSGRAVGVGEVDGYPRYDGFNCIHGIRLAFEHAGLEPAAFRAQGPTPADLGLAQRITARVGFTGYNFYRAAETVIRPSPRAS